MATHREALEAVFGSRDLEQLVWLFDERVIWRGLPDDEHEHDAVGADGDGQEADQHEHPPMCISRDDVREAFARFMAGGGTGYPVVLAEAGDSVVVDPGAEPPLPIPLHQSFTFRGGRVVLIQDYPDRASALADLGM
jgi:ketosteroid isomerase-like protein